MAKTRNTLLKGLVIAAGGFAFAFFGCLGAITSGDSTATAVVGGVAFLVGLVGFIIGGVMTVTGFFGWVFRNRDKHADPPADSSAPPPAPPTGQP